MNVPSIAVLVSGGLDSTLAYHYAQGYDDRAEVIPIFVDLGQPYVEKERAATARVLRDEPVVWVKADLCRPDLGGVPTPDNQEVWGRNLLLAFYGALRGSRVWLAALETEMGPHTVRDKQPEFFHMASALFTFTLKGLRHETVVETPFAHLTKSEALWMGLHEMDLEWEGETGLIHTSTCYHETKHNCGACSTCFKRSLATANCGVHERYLCHPIESNAYARRVISEMQAQIEADPKFKNPMARYSLRRCLETHNGMLAQGYSRGLWPKLQDRIHYPDSAYQPSAGIDWAELEEAKC